MEIVQYLRIGLLGRAKQFSHYKGKVPHLDMTIKLLSYNEIERFGQHICGYYTKVPISKKMFYEEFSNLLQEIDFLSV